MPVTVMQLSSFNAHRAVGVNARLGLVLELGAPAGGRGRGGGGGGQQAREHREPHSLAGWQRGGGRGC